MDALGIIHNACFLSKLNNSVLYQPWEIAKAKHYNGCIGYKIIGCEVFKVKFKLSFMTFEISYWAENSIIQETAQIKVFISRY